MSQKPLPKPPQDEGDRDGHSVVSIRYKNQLKQLLQDLNELPTDSPSIYLDASGIGSDRLIDLQLLVSPTNTLYLVDVRRLGDIAFSAVGHSEMSLRLILESKDIPKVGFDIRGISRLLFRQFNISLAGIYDLQLMELASRKEGQSMKFLSGLAKCIDQDIPSSNDTKIRWLTPEDTSNLHLYNTFGHVPNSSMKRVEMFPILWSVYKRKLSRPKNAVWLHLAQQESEQRVHDSKNAGSHLERQRWGPEVFWDNGQRQATIAAWDDGKLLEETSGGIEFCND
jgi:exonuclease 3'-5' domain-containing protein 1